MHPYYRERERSPDYPKIASKSLIFVALRERAWEKKSSAEKKIWESADSVLGIVADEDLPCSGDLQLQTRAVNAPAWYLGTYFYLSI